MSYFVVNKDCNGCLSCVENCPAGALDSLDRNHELTLRHNMAKCARCATCWRVCPQNAIEFQHLLENRWDEVITLELVGCKICGAPVMTQKLGESISKQTELPTGPLCEHHRARTAAESRIFSFSKKTSLKRNKTDDRR